MSQKPEKPKDPLDKVVVALGVVTVGCAAAAVRGTYWPLGAFAAVLGLGWARAPRRRFPCAQDICGDVAGKVALVTGPTSGIGEETARVLALNGCHVVLAARSSAKLQATRQRIEVSCAEHGKVARLTTLELDLDDLASVRACASAFLRLGLPLHILVNNAGIMALPKREDTKQGIEKQVGVCHVAHHLLTTLLFPTLEKSAPSRVVCVSSSAHRLHDPRFLDNPKLEVDGCYTEWSAYGNAKVSNLLFAREAHKRYGGKGVSAYSLHPGGIHTGLQGHVDAWTMFKWRGGTPHLCWKNC